MARRSASVLSFGIVREFHLGFLVWLTTYSRLPPQASPKNSLPSSYYSGTISLILVINLPFRPPTPDEGPSEPPQSQSSAVRKVKKKARMCALRIPNGSSEPGGPLETNHGETSVPSGGTSPSDFRHLTSSHRFSLSLLTSTLTKNASASPLTSTLTKTKDLKSFIINTYKKEGGVPLENRSKKVKLKLSSGREEWGRLSELPRAFRADSFRLHASNRRIQQFHHVQDGQRAPVALQPRGNLQQATGIAGNDCIGVCRRAVLCFAVPQLLRGSGRDQIVDTRRAAADFPVGNFHDLELGDCGQRFAGLRANALRVLQMAGIVIGDAHRQRLARRARFKLGEHFRDVLAARGKGPGALGISRVVAQQVTIVLEIGAAPGGIADDDVHTRALERVNQPPRQLQCRFFLARVDHQSAAAALLARRNHFAAFGGEHPHGGVIYVWKQDALHAPEQDADAQSRRALRLHPLRRFREQRAKRNSGKQLVHRAERRGKNLEHAKAFDEPADPKGLVKPDGQQQQPETRRVRKNGKDQSAIQSLAERPRMIALNLRARGFDQFIVLYAGRARGHARHAAQTMVKVRDEGIGHLRLAIAGQFHQVNPPARRIHLFVPQRVRRASRQAEAAMHAFADQFHRGRVVIVEGRHSLRCWARSGDALRVNRRFSAGRTVIRHQIPPTNRPGFKTWPGSSCALTCRINATESLGAPQMLKRDLSECEQRSATTVPPSVSALAHKPSSAAIRASSLDTPKLSWPTPMACATTFHVNSCAAPALPRAAQNSAICVGNTLNAATTFASPSFQSASRAFQQFAGSFGAAFSANWRNCFSCASNPARVPSKATSSEGSPFDSARSCRQEYASRESRILSASEESILNEDAVKLSDRASCGRGCKRNTASAMTPSVPSDPAASFGKSYPATFFTTLPPLRAKVPSAKASVTPMMRSRKEPNRARNAPLSLLARMPPMVARSGQSGSSASRCPCSASVRWNWSTLHPACTVAVMSPQACSRIPLSRAVERTRSTRRGGFPQPIFVPPPRGITASPARLAQARTFPSSSCVPGSTTIPGRTPSTWTAWVAERMFAAPTMAAISSRGGAVICFIAGSKD